MSDRQPGPIAKELIAAKKRIEDPENWCPEGLGEHGRLEHRVCAVNALASIGASSGLVYLQLTANEILDAAEEDSDSGCVVTNIVRVNAMGHAAVMQMYDHAIQRALSEGK